MTRTEKETETETETEIETEIETETEKIRLSRALKRVIRLTDKRQQGGVCGAEKHSE